MGVVLSLSLHSPGGLDPCPPQTLILTPGWGREEVALSWCSPSFSKPMLWREHPMSDSLRHYPPRNSVQGDLLLKYFLSLTHINIGSWGCQEKIPL